MDLPHGFLPHGFSQQIEFDSMRAFIIRVCLISSLDNSYIRPFCTAFREYLSSFFVFDFQYENGELRGPIVEGNASFKLEGIPRYNSCPFWFSHI